MLRLFRKRAYYISFILIVVNCLTANTQELKKPVIALVLSGGGAKGFAHIGALKILEEAGIPFDIIVGNSMGSIVGGLYSIGYSAGEIEQIAKSENWNNLLSDDVPRVQLSQSLKYEKQRYVLALPITDQKRPIVPHGAIKGQNILNTFSDLTGNVPVDADFSKFPINFACISTDIETGKEIVINNGLMTTAIYSSMAIPGVFLPICHNGRTSFDGGVANNFPTDVAKAMGADIIIGVDIRNDLHSANDIKSIQHLMDQLINFYTIEKDSVNKSYCSILIRPDITGFNAYSFSTRAVDTLVNRGIKAALLMLPEIEELKRKYNLEPRTLSREYVKKDSWYITKINFAGKYSINDKLLLDKLNLTTPGQYSYSEIKEAIDRVYGLGCISRAYFSLADDVAGKILTLNIEEEGVSNINVGMRLNSTEAVSIVLNYTQRDYRRYIGLISVTADISSQPGFNLTGEISKGKFPVIGLQIDGKYRNYNIYADGKKSNSAEIFYGAASIYSYKTIKNHATVGVGFKEEFFLGNIFSIEADSVAPPSRSSISNLFAFYSYDNLDNFYFPSKGTELYTEASILEDQDYNNINPVAYLKIRNYIGLNHKYCLLLNAYGRAIFTSNSPIFKNNYVGGTDFEIYLSNHLPFYGIPSIMPTQRYTAIGLTGLRVKVAKKHFFSFLANYLFQSDDIITGDYDTIWGVGLGYSYNSRVGPLNLEIGYSDWYKIPTLAANIGFWF